MNGLVDDSRRALLELKVANEQSQHEPEFFGRFELSDHTLLWPNGADFAPEYLRDVITQTDSASQTMQRSGE